MDHLENWRAGTAMGESGQRMSSDGEMGSFDTDFGALQFGLSPDLAGTAAVAQSTAAWPRAIDPVSGLLQRQALMAGFEALLARGSRGVVMVVVRLEGLAEVRAVLGSVSADRLVAEFSHNLQAMPGLLLAGDLGGGDFALVFHAEGDPLPYWRNFARQVSGAYPVQGSMVLVRAAIGFSQAGMRAAGPGLADILLREALMALSAAVKIGPGEVVGFDRGVAQASRRRLILANELYQAQQHGDFRFVYEPKYRLSDKIAVGVDLEVLWQHPVFGARRQAEFWDQADESGIADEILLGLLPSISGLAAKVNRDRVMPMALSLTLSAAQIRRGILTPALADAVKRGVLRGEWIQLSVTEATLNAADGAMFEQLALLDQMGISLAVSQVGAGFPLMARKGGLHFREMRLLPTLTSNGGLAQEPLLRALAQWAARQEVDLVCVDVKTESERQSLHGMGCRLGQGAVFRNSQMTAPQARPSVG